MNWQDSSVQLLRSIEPFSFCAGLLVGSALGIQRMVFIAGLVSLYIYRVEVMEFIETRR